MRPRPFIRSFGDMSSSMIVIVISIGRLVRVIVGPSETLVANALRSEAGLIIPKQGGASALTEDVLLHGLRIGHSPF